MSLLVEYLLYSVALHCIQMCVCNHCSAWVIVAKSSTSRTPSPATSNHSKSHNSPPLSTGTTNDKRYPLNHPQADAADILRQAAAEAAKSVPGSSNSRTNLMVSVDIVIGCRLVIIYSKYCSK